MADKITMELYEYEDIKEKYPYWNQFPLMKELYMKGKKPMVLHADIVLDTSTATTLTETGAPTNEVLNFAAPVQLFLVSDNAGDTSKKINVIGQKADGSFGNFTLTSDASDGTTAVDYGLWKTILWVGKIDTWAGNVTLDVDGAGGTNYFTLALGVNATTGIFVIPDGYCGAGIDASSRATVVITTVNEMSMLLDHVFAATLNLYNPIVRFVNNDVIEEGKITFRSAYHTAPFETKSHVLIALWEV